MTLDQMRYFVAAAKFEHVGRAAQSIPISASVISQSIKLLEEELNCKLFIRDKKRIRLSMHGMRLLELSADVLGKADGIKQELGKANLPLSGHYRIGASHFLAAKVLAPVWTSMQTRFPNLTADIHSQATWVLLDSILAGRIDFGIGFSPTPHPHLETEEIYRGYSEVVVRKGHPLLAEKKRQPYKLLDQYPATIHMATEKVFSCRQFPHFKNANLDRNVVFSFDSDFVALENLKASNNWALMLDLIVADFRGHLQPIPVPFRSEMQYTVQIIKHKSRKTDAVMLEAFDLIKRQIQKKA